MFQIVVDSAANIPAELVKKYDIRVISFVNYVNGKRWYVLTPTSLPRKKEQRAGSIMMLSAPVLMSRPDLSAAGILKTCSALF